MSNQLQHAFEQAKKQYPDAWISDYSDDWDFDHSKVLQHPHTWQLVDACSASFHTPERKGMLVLQECRPGCSTPSNHWGFMVSKEEMGNER